MGGTEVCPSCPGMGEGGLAVSGGGRDRNNEFNHHD